MAGDYLERSLGIKRDVHGEHHMEARLSVSTSVSSQTCLTFDCRVVEYSHFFVCYSLSDIIIIQVFIRSHLKCLLSSLLPCAQHRWPR
jgi:hypothetical protein